MQPASPPTSDCPAPATLRPDGPGVRIPPPVIYAAAFLIGLLLQARFPLPFLSPMVARGTGSLLLCGFAGLLVTSIPTMLRRGGTLNTNGASQQLVTTGVYRISRNPMYLSVVLLYGGLACVIGITWALLLLPLLVLYTQYFAIAREERFLERAFGDEYHAYKARVRRWL